MANEIIKPTKQELNDEAISQFYEAFHKSFKQEESPLGDFLFKELRKGKKTIYNKSIRETKSFDSSYIDVLKSAYSSLAKICKDPKKSIKYEQEIIAMEKAKKLTSESIRHLASHTHYIKEIKNDGSVVPSKVMSTYSDDEFGIYENRFIKTLINRVVKFLSVRLDLMKKNAESYQAERIRYTNNRKIDGALVEVSIDVKVKNEIEEKVSTAKKTLEQVDYLLTLFKSLKSSTLYQSLTNAKEVHPPIMKTNIILHNPDFKIAYNLWVYLERTTNLGYDVDLKEKRHNDSESIVLNMDKMSAVLVNELLYRRGIRGFDFTDGRTYKKEQIKRAEIDDESQHNYKFSPDNIKLDNQDIPEYLLNEALNIYGKSMDEALEAGMTQEISFKKVFREMLEVTNKIYPLLMNAPIDEEFDVKTTNEQKLELARNELKISKIIKEQKQLDFNRTIKNHEKLEKQVLSLEKKVKAEEKKKKDREKLQKEREKKAKIKQSRKVSTKKVTKVNEKK